MMFSCSMGPFGRMSCGRLDASGYEVEEAIRAAKLDQVIEQLPDGLDTAIVNVVYASVCGQKQRLSIARIFLKNPSILILDARQLAPRYANRTAYPTVL